MGINSSKCPVCGRPPKIVECPECEGYGIVDCEAYFVDSEDLEEVTAAEYISLPDEDEAVKRGLERYKGDSRRCPCCLGRGRVYEEDDDKYYPII